LLTWSKQLALLESHLEEAPFEEYSSDAVRVGAAPGIEHIDPICTKSLDLVPISSPFVLTTPSHLHAFYKSLRDISESQPSFDPLCAYLEDLPRKVTWSTFFDHAFDFSMTFDKFKMALTLFVTSLLVFSYLHHYKMHALAYDELL